MATKHWEGGGKGLLPFPRIIMVIRLLKSKKGISGIIAFALVFTLLLLPALNTFNMLQTLYRYDAFRQVGRAALLQMEISGGLTPSDLANLKLELGSKGFEQEKVHVDYTPAAVAYGEDVWIAMRYPYKSVTYTITLGGLKKNEIEEEMVYGPISSTSKRYFK